LIRLAFDLILMLNLIGSVLNSAFLINPEKLYWKESLVGFASDQSPAQQVLSRAFSCTEDCGGFWGSLGSSAAQLSRTSFCIS
jgi:hypothetical protein